jgi:hypothetical protein
LDGHWGGQAMVIAGKSFLHARRTEGNMKLTEQIKILRQIAENWDTKPLVDDAEDNLASALFRALANYDYEKRHGHPPRESVCLLCGKLWSECYC